MRRMLWVASVIALASVPGTWLAPIGSGLARAESSTNDPTAVMVAGADACVLRLREIYSSAAKLEEKAPPDQAVLIDCVHSRVLKIKGLLEMTEGKRKKIQEALKAEETDALKDTAADVKISCARAEKLLLEAEGCATSLVLKTVRTNAAPVAVTNASVNIKITPRATAAPVVRRPVMRTVQTCLHHEQFAIMLARAMSLGVEEHATADEFMKTLAKLAVEPLGGWQLGRCVTVDDVYVACARAMNLKVKDAQDPLSYGQALRDEGLGVDALLPERDPQLDSPYVLDSEVREFLMTGYAAPLPSSRRVAPD